MLIKCFRKRFAIGILILLFFSSGIVSLVVAEPVFGGSPMIDSSMASAAAAIDAQLRQYDYEAAYTAMMDFIRRYPSQSNSETYVRVLAQMMALESHYWIYDKMVQHANELFNLTNAPELWRYRVEALDVFAYYDYYNYENFKAIEKYQTLQNLAAGINPNYYMPQYFQGMALLAVDDLKYEEAHLLADKAIAFSSKPYAQSVIHAPLLPGLYQLKADIYHAQEHFPEAVQWLKKAYDALSEKDLERRTSMGLMLSKYYLDAGQLAEAKATFSSVLSDYQRTGSLYQKNTEESALMSVEAMIAYSTGDYKRAAELYSELARQKSSPQEVQETIDANKQASKFEFAAIDQQINLMAQLQEEQQARISLQQKSLLFAYGAIGLLVLSLVGLFMAIRFQISQRQRFYKISITDQLTQLFNRRKILEEYEALKPGEYCVALMDLDRFKQINDTYGHHAGDEVLRVVAETMRKSIRPQDLIGRYGGEEFLVIFNTQSLSVARDIAERIRCNIEALEWSYPGLHTTMSIGLVHSENHTGEFLLGEADGFLYLAKAEGRNRVEAAEI